MKRFVPMFICNWTKVFANKNVNFAFKLVLSMCICFCYLLEVVNNAHYFEVHRSNRGTKPNGFLLLTLTWCIWSLVCLFIQTNLLITFKYCFILIFERNRLWGCKFGILYKKNYFSGKIIWFSFDALEKRF